MEISGVSSTSSYDLLQQLQEEKDKKTEEQAAEQATAASSAQIAATGTVTDVTTDSTAESTTQNVDTVEISAEGKAYQQQMQASPPPKGSGVSEASTDDTETSTVLTNLSEEEISQLVEDGTITQAQANAELARRAALEEAEESQNDDDQMEEQEDLYIDNED